MFRHTLNKRLCQRTFHSSMRTWSKGAKDDEAAQTAKKYVGKIHEEEKSKEPHPSPISQKSREKYSEMEKKTQEHDEKKQK
ncbi:hypothetical protein O0I10_010389 [Lichtheimia ornata]|uniref:Uncharacterized protein n=1 Tax=Lichtheimia ornata TaxID=688661 RepID=A0AAD7UWQ9_9FUNG|nr:uncharacterized protein O0I10_010389 [Lichtheimia ornata]KAJ8653940.1 hypothetical protein O0I10_010389 [Lichtheimia ornata]